MIDATANGWTCPGCGTDIEPPFAVCYHCGTNSKGEPDPAFRREVDAGDDPGRPPAAFEQTKRASVRRRWQFTLRGLFVSLFVLCGLLAISHYAGAIVWYAVLYILVANALGLVVGWIVTHVFGLPNDGSDRYDRR